MARRKQIGLLYSYDEQWIAGAYYILNIIYALDRLSDENKPELTIFSDSLETYHNVVEATRYPYLRFL
jgi:recombinational DNA repair protein (RecF pathway)